MNTDDAPAIAVAGDWVQLHTIVLAPEQRTARIPDDTRRVPFESWVKGFLLTERATTGEEVEATTTCGRHVSGELVAINPGYDHGFGHDLVPELLGVGPQARQILREANRA